MTTSPTAVRAVWTDFGGVLTPPISRSLDALCARLGVQPDVLGAALWKVTRRYGTDDVMLLLDTPLVAEAAWLAQVSAELLTSGVRLEIPSLATAWFGDREVNRRWLERLRSARAAGMFVGLLSNMIPAWDAYWRRMVPPEGLFDDVVLSFEVGHRKPAREIFELAARRSGIPPEESMLVDDLAKNCDGARDAGWRAVHFTDTAAAIATVDRMIGATEQLG